MGIPHAWFDTLFMYVEVHEFQINMYVYVVVLLPLLWVWPERRHYSEAPMVWMLLKMRNINVPTYSYIEMPTFHNIRGNFSLLQNRTNDCIVKVFESACTHILSMQPKMSSYKVNCPQGVVHKVVFTE